MSAWPQELLNELGVYAVAEQESGARVPEIVVPYPGQSGAPERRLESAIEVAAQQWRTDGGGKH